MIVNCNLSWICCLNIYLEKLLNPDRLWSNVWPLVEVSDFERFGVVHLEDDHDNMLEYDLAGWNISKQITKFKNAFENWMKTHFRGRFVIVIVKTSFARPAAKKLRITIEIFSTFPLPLTFQLFINEKLMPKYLLIFQYF